MFLHGPVALSTGGGVSRPRPRGEVGGSGRVCVQAHTQGLQAHTQGGVSRPRPGGVQAEARGCIPACTEADTHPQQTATAAGGTHPTGMHSCCK